MDLIVHFFRIPVLLIILVSNLYFSSSAFSQDKGKFTDERDKNSYGWVKIGNDIWMSENLRFATPQGSWAYNNDPSKVTRFGRLYSFEAASTVCPQGWYLPTQAEWTTLIEYLGGTDEAGSALKEKGTTHWMAPNADATNSSGFSAFAGGMRFFNQDGFNDLGKTGYFWTGTSVNETYSFYYCMSYDKWKVFKYTSEKPAGFSVRCVKTK